MASVCLLWVPEELPSVRAPRGARVTSEHSAAVPPALRQEIDVSAEVAPGKYTSEDVREVAAVTEMAAGPSFSLLDLELLPAGVGSGRPRSVAHDV